MSNPTTPEAKPARKSNAPRDGIRKSSDLGYPMSPANVKIDPDTGCWNWQGRMQPTGYGRFGRPFAHRYYYELLVGPIPEGLQIDHLCRNRGCVNPAHLEPVTARVNTLRSNNRAARNSRKTECNQGHALTEDNTVRRVTDGREWRECRECKRAWAATTAARKRAREAA